MSRFAYLALFVAAAVACKSDITPPPPPAPPPPPPPPNHAPVAVVGGPYESDSGSVSFDGSASSDSDGDALTFAWQFGDGGTSAEVKPTHSYAGDGEFNVSLTVTDSKGLASTPSTTTARIAPPAPVLVGAGNIATCGSSNDQATAALIDVLPDAKVFTLGDNVFPRSTPENYTNCYQPAWGRFLDRTRAVLGNHEYEGDPDATFDYFGDRAGPRGLGYYSYDLGAWHIVVLNDRGSSSIDTDQLNWLVADLAANTKQCTLAMWHVPLFLSSHTPGWNTNPEHKPIWDALYNAGADVVLNGQQHNYERFAPMTPSGTVDSARGVREFNVGTGGESVDNFEVIHPNSEVRTATFGVLKLTLKSSGYDWQFIPVAGQSFTDSGSGSCH